jgi:hypothetical protein
MKSMWIKSLALAAATVGYSHAIFGIGGHWAPAPSLAVKSSSGILVGSGASAVTIDQGKVDGLNGFGAKLWIDALPFIDLEAGSNIQYGLYDVSVSQGGNKKDITFDLGVPTVDKPGFARIVSDVTILYPFLKLPPVISLAKFSAGAGISHVLATEVLNAGFAKKAVDKAVAATPGSADTPEEVAAILAKSIKDEGLTSGVGFHIELSAKVSPPIVPIAVYADIKYHFLSTMPSAVDANSMTMELGAALAF